MQNNYQLDGKPGLVTFSILISLHCMSILVSTKTQSDNYFKTLKDDIICIVSSAVTLFSNSQSADKNKTQDRTRYDQKAELLTGPAQRVSHCLPKLLSRIYDYWKAIVCSFTVREQTYVSLM